MAEAMDFGAAERMLLEAEVRECKPLWWSSNYVYLATMATADGEEFVAVYKPAAGEAPLWDFPTHTLYRREAAAYRLAQLLGWAFVPPTVVRGGPHGVGSMQVYIKHDAESHFFVQRETAEMIPQLQRMCLFDWIANNADRKGGHCLLDDAGRVWGIDHGLCFNREDKLRSVIWDWAGEPIPDAWLTDVAGLLECLVQSAPDVLGLRELLAPEEAVTLARRMERAVKLKRFPAPGANRHYPWPLV